MHMIQEKLEELKSYTTDIKSSILEKFNSCANSFQDRHKDLSEKIELYKKEHWTKIFPNGKIDLALRYRDPSNKLEIKQQESIYIIDQWCN